ncbi:Mov34-domain-containing protein [Hypoxylon sp. NC1633]|nr:Mov34-domain-containing protein [Hypoxylon sp. NC1633]
MASETDSFLHMSRPLAPTTLNFQSSVAPLNVTIQPQAIFSILDHAIRSDIPSSSRVIGALVGIRSEEGSEVNVSSSFAIPHTENEDQVEVDVDYQRNMLSLHLRAHPREVLLGWYTTSHELNSFSALIQNFFASPETGTFPHPSVHLTVDADPFAQIRTKTYISGPIAVNSERAPETCMFMEVPHHLAYNDAERSALDTIASAKDSESRTAPIGTDVQALSGTITHIVGTMDRVNDYLSTVIDEEREANNTLGQYMTGTLSLNPKVEPLTIESDFNNHIQDVLMVSYLANSIRTQIDLSQRLATATLSEEGVKTDGKDGEKENKGERGERGERGQRGNRRGGRGGGRGGQQREPREPREPRENGD